MQAINYVSCHDNHTLWDKLSISTNASEDDRKKMQKLAVSAVLLGQSVPFLHAGVEFYRTKNGVENSFESPDNINQIDWTRKAENLEMVEFVQQLIALRKKYLHIGLGAAEAVQQQVVFKDSAEDHILVEILGAENNLLISVNAGDKKVLEIDAKNLKVALSSYPFSLEEKINQEALSILVFERKK